MPKSRALKEQVMPMMREDTPKEMMREAKEMISSSKNSMMRGQMMMTGAKVMMAKKKMPKKDPMMEYSDLGGMNFDPKKLKGR